MFYFTCDRSLIAASAAAAAADDQDIFQDLDFLGVVSQFIGTTFPSHPSPPFPLLPLLSPSPRFPTHPLPFPFPLEVEPLKSSCWSGEELETDNGNVTLSSTSHRA